MTKKLLFLVPALVLLIAGCGSKDSSDTSTGGTDSSTTSTGTTGGNTTTSANTTTPTTGGTSGGAPALQAKTGGHFINPNGEGDLSKKVGAKSGGN
jgi:hypothetical protein